MRNRAKFLLTAPPTVLVAGVDAAGQSVLKAILQRAGYCTLICDRGRDAMELIEFASVVICEDSLPDCPWQDILRKARTLAKPPALIVTSPVTDGRLAAEVRTLGGYDVLAQPFRSEDVLWAVQDAHGRNAASGGITLEGAGVPAGPS